MKDTEYFNKGDIVMHRASGKRAIVVYTYFQEDGSQIHEYDISTCFSEFLKYVDGIVLEKYEPVKYGMAINDL